MADMSRTVRNGALILGIPAIIFLVFLIFDRDRVRWLWRSDRVEIGRKIDDFIDWLRDTFQAFWDFLDERAQSLIDSLADVLGAPSAFVFAVIATVLVLLLRAGTLTRPYIGIRGVVGALPLALFTFLSFRLVDAMNQWEEFTDTFALIVIATILAVAIAVPVGVSAAHHRTVSMVVRPVLDFMQTLPVFVYLLPAVFFFGIGVVAGLAATLVFSIPPGVRLTELGIRQVDTEVVEAAEAFGASKRQLLWGVKMPLAMPSIMQGVNQVLMLALSMVVVAGLVGAGGLGSSVNEGVSRQRFPLGFEGGLAVVVMAIFLDRLTSILRDRTTVQT